MFQLDTGGWKGCFSSMVNQVSGGHNQGYDEVQGQTFLWLAEDHNFLLRNLVHIFIFYSDPKSYECNVMFNLVVFSHSCHHSLC